MRQRYFLGIGDNYPGTDYELNGCVNDANDWAEYAADRGFTTQMLLDETATRDSMLAAIEDVVARTGWGDRAVIFNSGHGTYVPDISGDEDDRRDEAICPYDFATAGVITDDTLFEIFSKKRYGARVVAIFDTCNSGTATRSLMEPPRPGMRAKYLPPSAHLKGEALERAVRAETAPLATPSRPTVPLLAAAHAAEYAWDAWFPDGHGGWRAGGAFSQTALALLREDSDVTYSRLMSRIREVLPSGSFPQTPQYDHTTYASRYWKVFA